MKRLAWIDNLRVMVIILVVMLHAGVTYSGIGGWYYKEEGELDHLSLLFFAFFQTFTQAYFMSLLFMVSGYFSAVSMDKKGTGPFLAGRIKRLGIPLLIFIFLLHPISVKLAYPDLEILSWYWNGIKHFNFLSWTGPLWFVEALLIFTFVYVFFRRVFARFSSGISFSLKPVNVIILILLITLVAFLVRLVFPIGSNVLNLQFSFFSAYVFMFAIGVVARSVNLFEQINYNSGKRYLIVSLALGIPLWTFIILNSGALDGIMLIEGGWNWPAFAYALWESFFCVTFIIALIGLFKRKMNIGGSFQKFLSDNAFGVFVFHTPVLIATSMLLREVAMHPVLKFFMASAIAVSASFITAWMVRRPKFLRRIFT